MFHFVLIYYVWLLTLISAIFSDQPCPKLDDFLNRSPYLAQFNSHLYQSIWYELAFYDYTQLPKECGCTFLNWTLSDKDPNIYSDYFTTSYPYEPIGIRKNYTVHMNDTVDSQHYPFYIPETSLRIQFNNTVGKMIRFIDKEIFYIIVIRSLL